MVKRVIRIWNGIYEQDFDTDLSVDLIKEVGHNGTYLTHESTFQHYRNRWDRSPIGTPIAPGKKKVRKTS